MYRLKQSIMFTDYFQNTHGLEMLFSGDVIYKFYTEMDRLNLLKILLPLFQQTIYTH